MTGREGARGAPGNRPPAAEPPPAVLPMIASGLPKAQRGGREGKGETGSAAGVDDSRALLEKRGLALVEARLAGMTDASHCENVRELMDWGLDFWGLSDARMMELSWSMLREWGLHEAFKIHPARFAALLAVLFEHSHPVPYHNKRHWFSVAATTWAILHGAPEVRRHLSRLELLASIVAALGHDTDHPGVTNGFLSLLKHDLALRYNDISILENHHCATFFGLLAREDCDFLSGLSRKEFATLRGLVVACILNTDMARHFNLLEDFKQTEKMPKGWSSSEGGRRTLLSMVVHCADIGNPLRGWNVYKKSADRIADEFCEQVRLEDYFNLPRTAHMEGLEKAGARAKMEVGFTRVFASPTLLLLKRRFPQLEERVAVLRENCQRWEKL